jgi:hypothetical protein
MDAVVFQKVLIYDKQYLIFQHIVFLTNRSHLEFPKRTYRKPINY